MIHQPSMIARRAGSLAGAVVLVLSAVEGATPARAATPTAPTFVQAVASTTKAKVAFTNPVAAGDVLIAGITTNDGGTDPISGVSDSLNGAWTKVTSIKYGNGHVDLYYHSNSAAGSDTVTFSGSQSAFTIAEYGGVQGSPTALDQFASKAGTGSPSAGPTAPIGRASELVIGVGGNPAPGSTNSAFSGGTGFTLRTQAVTPWTFANGLEDSLSSSTAGQTMSMKSTTSSYFGAIVAVFKSTPAAAPKAALTVNPSSGAAPLSVTADASASTDPVGITSYTFAFGDGTVVGPQPGATATHNYTAGGKYTVQVTVGDTAGATAIATAPVTVGAPVAALTLNPTSGVTPLLVTADASASSDPIGISMYTFNFGDGSPNVGPQAGATATHTYSASGVYTVTLTVNDSVGGSAIAHASVTTVAPPTAALTVSPPNGAAPLAVTADASASVPGSNPITSYTFDFGDSTSVGPQAGSSASHTYATGGHYTVKVTVTDSAGDTGTATKPVMVGAPTAALALNPGSGAAPLAVTANASASTDPIGISSYTFNFGDGTVVGPQAGASASHTYSSSGSYAVVVTVTDTAGASATATGLVLVGAPVAALTVTPGSGPAPLAVTADASGSTDPIGITSYTFNFGDGTTVGPQAATQGNHTYAAGGNYTVKVTVTDGAGVSSSTTQTVAVGSPKAVLTVIPNSGGAPLNVTADASGSTDPIGISSYTFNFGDGTVVGPQAGPTATHTYTATGPYTVTVTVADSAGGSASAIASVTVAAPPTPALTVTPVSGPAPLLVTADASASTAGTSPIASFKFDFGDGTTIGPQAAPTASHVYSTGGSYSVTVTVTDTLGVSATATAGVIVVAPPTAALIVSPSSGATPLAVTANASGSTAGSNPIASYLFNFGDGTVVGPQATPVATHTYSSASSYTVTVTVTDSSGATASATGSVTASAPPTAALVVSPLSGAAPLPVTADASASTAGSNPIANYVFDFGDGTKVGPQPGAQAHHTYSNGGTYLVAVTVTDGAGYAATAAAMVTVGAPTARLKVTPAIGATPLVVAADASASTDPIGIASYTFNFGDGTVVGPQAWPTATHTYSSAANYTVTVTVVDGTGASASATMPVTAVIPPTAALTVSPGIGATPLAVIADASGSTPGTNPIASYTFSFGDGTIVGPQVGPTAKHTYTTAASFIVSVTVSDSQNVSATATSTVAAVTPPTPRLTVTPPSGAVPLAVTADGSGSSAGSNPIATYGFNFGDGTIPELPSATSTTAHTYSSPGTYQVVLTVTDTAGVSATATATVTVVNPPTAVLTATPGSGVAPVTVTADASGSSDSAGISSYTFDFGDGSPVVGPQAAAKATHVYTTAGNFTLTVTVTDTAQATSNASASVAVLAPPTAGLSLTPISGFAPLSVITSAATSAGGTYPIASYTFNFGDGTPPVGPQPGSSTSHVYLNPGAYTATLTVIDSQGNAGSTSAVVNVSSGVLAQDTFTRPNQSGWGTASTGIPWAPTGPSLSISNNEGVISSTASSLIETLGTATTADANGLVRFSVASSTDTAGILLRVQSNGNTYLGRYDGAGHLQFEYKVGSSWTHVALVNFTPTLNSFYWLRFMLQGTNVNLKAWAHGTTEPTGWNWSGTSSGITSAGEMGLYGYAGPGTPVQLDSFTVSAVGNPVPNSTISGTVTDVTSGAPIAGVQVSTLPVTTTATTSTSGTYSLGVPAGAFAVVFTASSGGYNANFLAGVQAPANGTVSANQTLTAIPAQTAMDTFTQPNQSNGFGISTDGNVWSSDLGTYPGAQAGITNGQAWMDTQSSSTTDFDTWMGYQYQNQQITADLNMNTILVDPVYQHGARLLARVQNSTTWVLMTVDPTTQDLELWVALNNNWTELAVVSEPISTKTWYHAKLDVIGNLVEGKVWAFGSTEPGWEITASQHTVNGSGQAGLRTTGAYVQYANFQQTPITQISGIVTSVSSGAPIANATVTLNTGASTTTDAFGNYTLTGLFGGTTYTVTASASGYIQNSIQVTPQAGTTGSGNISLSP